MTMPSRRTWIWIALALFLFLLWCVWRKTMRYAASVAAVAGLAIGAFLVITNPAAWFHWIIVGTFAVIAWFWQKLWGDAPAAKPDPGNLPIPDSDTGNAG